MNRNTKEKTIAEIFPGIYRISLPLPGRDPGPVNVYLFTGKIVTLIDTGTSFTSDRLEKELGTVGVSFSDIEQIIITHGHFDHCGAIGRILQKARRHIQVLAHEDDVPMIETGSDVPRKTVRDFMKVMGLPRRFGMALNLFELLSSVMSVRGTVDRMLEDGSTVELGGYLGRIIATPGHSKGSVCIYLEKEGLLFSGDHVLEHITPVALIMFDHFSPIPVRMSQEEYYQSIAKIESLDVKKVFPAHGREIDDLGKTISMYRQQFSRRQNEILALVSGEEQSVYQLSRKLFPDIRGARLPLEVFLAITETYTHLQVLEKEKRVIMEKLGGLIMVSSAGEQTAIKSTPESRRRR